MPNPIKYSTSAQTLALKKGNFWIGTGDVGKGPTSTTDYYNGITPPSGGYTIYLNKASGGPSIYTAANDSQLISLSNTIAGQTFATAAAALAWFATQTDKMVFNIDYPAIVTNGLVFNLDAGFTPSYPTTGTSWYDVSSGGNNGSLINSPTFSSANGGSIVFDGVDDYVSGTEIAELGYTNNYTIIIWLKNTNNGYVFSNKSNVGERFGINIGSTSVVSGFFYNGSTYTTVGGNIRSGVWEQVVVVNQNQQLTLYVSMNKSTTGGSPADPGQNGLRIGRRNRTSEIYFNGSISQIQVYNRAFTESEVLQNFNAQKSRFGL